MDVYLITIYNYFILLLNRINEIFSYIERKLREPTGRTEEGLIIQRCHQDVEIRKYHCGPLVPEQKILVFFNK